MNAQPQDLESSRSPVGVLAHGAPGAIRTHDTTVKGRLLVPLSYGSMLPELVLLSHDDLLRLMLLREDDGGRTRVTRVEAWHLSRSVTSPWVPQVSSLPTPVFSRKLIRLS